MSHTIYDVAKLAGVSTATVSRVINKLGNVKPGTEEKVKAAMDALEFTPSFLAQSFASNKSFTIGLVLSLDGNQQPTSQDPSMASYYQTELFRGINSILETKGFSLLIINTRETSNEALNVLFDQRKIDGLIIGHFTQISPALRTLIEKKAPIVYIGHLHHFDKGLHVYAQYTQYLLSVLTYFQSNGHHKILFIGARKPDSIQSEWEDMNVTIHKTLSIDFVEAVFDKEQLCQMITDRFSSQNRPSAIFCENLSDIQPIISSLNQLHLSIPEDVSIISVEHFKDAGVNFYPKITNVYVPVFEMGQAAIQLLMDYINGKLKSPYDFQLTIESKLIERDSVRNIATD